MMTRRPAQQPSTDAHQLALFDIEAASAPMPALASLAPLLERAEPASVPGESRDAASCVGDGAVPAAMPEVPARPQATTLRGAIDEYRDYLVALNRSKHTRESFALDLKLLLEHLGDAPLTAIGERD